MNGRTELVLPSSSWTRDSNCCLTDSTPHQIAHEACWSPHDLHLWATAPPTIQHAPHVGPVMAFKYMLTLEAAPVVSLPCFLICTCHRMPILSLMLARASSSHIPPT